MKMEINTLAAQYPIGEGVAVVTATERKEIKALLHVAGHSAGLCRQFNRDLIGLARQIETDPDPFRLCSILLVYSFRNPAFL